MSVTLAWDPNPEPDVVAYVIYYGTNSRAYPYATNVGNVTCATVHGLDPCTLYYFALTAVNQAGLESDFSLEVTNWTFCVHLEIRQATNPAGPWVILFSTNVPRNKVGAFFKTTMTPQWPCVIAPTEWCSNGVPIKYPEDTNTFDLPPVLPAEIPTNQTRLARPPPYRLPAGTSTNR